MSVFLQTRRVRIFASIYFFLSFKAGAVNCIKVKMSRSTPRNMPGEEILKLINFYREKDNSPNSTVPKNCKREENRSFKNENGVKINKINIYILSLGPVFVRTQSAYIIWTLHNFPSFTKQKYTRTCKMRIPLPIPVKLPCGVNYLAGHLASLEKNLAALNSKNKDLFHSANFQS